MGIPPTGPHPTFLSLLTLHLSMLTLKCSRQDGTRWMKESSTMQHQHTCIKKGILLNTAGHQKVASASSLLNIPRKYPWSTLGEPTNKSDFGNYPYNTSVKPTRDPPPNLNPENLGALGPHREHTSWGSVQVLWLRKDRRGPFVFLLRRSQGWLAV